MMEQGLVSSPTAKEVPINRWKEFNEELADHIIELKKQLALAVKRRSDAAKVPGDLNHLQEKVVELRSRLRSCRMERDTLKEQVNQLVMDVEKLKGGDAAVLEREAKALERVKLVESELQCANQEAASKGNKLEVAMKEAMDYKNLYKSARADAEENGKALSEMNDKCAGLQVRLGDAEIAMEKLKAEKLDVDTKLHFSEAQFAGLKDSLKAMSVKDAPDDGVCQGASDATSSALVIVTPRGGPSPDTPKSSVKPATPEPTTPVRPIARVPKSCSDVKGEVAEIVNSLDELVKQLKASERAKRDVAEQLQDTESTLKGLEIAQNSDVGIYEKELLHGTQPDLSPRPESWDVRRDGVPGEALAEVRRDVEHVRLAIESSFRGGLRGIAGIQEKLTPVAEYIKKDHEELYKAKQAAWDMGVQLATAIQDGDAAKAMVSKLERELDGAQVVHKREIKNVQERMQGMGEKLAKEVAEKKVVVQELQELEESVGVMKKELDEKHRECEKLGNHVIMASRSLRGDVLVIHQDLENRRHERDTAVKRRVHSELRLREVEREKARMEWDRQGVQRDVERLKEENDRAFRAVDQLENKLKVMIQKVEVLEGGREEHGNEMKEAHSKMERVNEEKESLTLQLLAMEKEVELLNEHFDVALEEKVDVQFQLKALEEEYIYLNASAENLAKKVLLADADAKDLAAANDQLIDQLDEEKRILDEIKAAMGQPLKNSGGSNKAGSHREDSATSLEPLFEGEVLEVAEDVVADKDLVLLVEAMVKENRDLKGMVYSLDKEKGRLENLHKPDPIIVYKEMGGDSGGAEMHARELKTEAGFLMGELMSAENSNKMLKVQLGEAMQYARELEDTMFDMDSEIEAAHEGLKSVSKDSLLKELADLKEANRKQHSKNRDLASQLDIATNKVKEFDKMFQAGSPGSGFLASKNVALQNEVAKMQGIRDKLKSDLQASNRKCAELQSDNKMLLVAIDGVAQKYNDVVKFAPQQIQQRALSPDLMNMVAQAKKKSQENDDQEAGGAPSGNGDSQGRAGGSGSNQGGNHNSFPSGNGNSSGNGNDFMGSGGGGDDDGGENPDRWVGIPLESENASDFDEEEGEEEQTDEKDLLDKMGCLWQGSIQQPMVNLPVARSRMGSCKQYPYSMAELGNEEEGQREYVEVQLVVKQRDGKEMVVGTVMASRGTQTNGGVGRITGDDMSKEMSRKWHGVSERDGAEQALKKLQGEFDRLHSRNIENIGKLRVLEFNNQKMKAELEAALVGNKYLEGELRGKTEANRLLMAQLEDAKDAVKKIGNQRELDCVGVKVQARGLPGFSSRGGLGAVQEEGNEEGEELLAQLEDAHAEISVLRSRIADSKPALDGGMERGQFEAKSLQEALEQSLAEKADLQQNLECLDSELRMSTEQGRSLAAFQGENKKLQKERDAEKKEKIELKRAYDRISEVLKGNEAERTKMEEEVAKLKDEKAELKGHREKIMKQKAESDRMLNEAKQHEIRATYLDRQLQVTNEKCKNKDRAVAQLEQQVDELKKEAGKLRDGARDWHKERDILKGDLCEAQQQGRAATDSVASIENELERVKQQRDRVKDDYELLKLMKGDVTGGQQAGTRGFSLENAQKMKEGQEVAAPPKAKKHPTLMQLGLAAEKGSFPTFGVESDSLKTPDKDTNNPFSAPSQPFALGYSVPNFDGNDKKASSAPSASLFGQAASLPNQSGGLFSGTASTPTVGSGSLFGAPPSPLFKGGFSVDSKTSSPARFGSGSFPGETTHQLGGSLFSGKLGGGTLGGCPANTGSARGTSFTPEVLAVEKPESPHSNERSPSPTISDTIRMGTPERVNEEKAYSPTPPRTTSTGDFEAMDAATDKLEWERTREVTPEPHPEVSACGDIEKVPQQASDSLDQIPNPEKTERHIPEDGDGDLSAKLEMAWSTGSKATESHLNEGKTQTMGEMVMSKEEVEKLKKDLHNAESQGVQRLGQMVLLQNKNTKLAAKLKAAECRLKQLEEAESNYIRSIAMVKLLENNKIRMGAEIESLRMELGCVVGEFENKKVGNRRLRGELADRNRQVDDLKNQVKARDQRIAELEQALGNIQYQFGGAAEGNMGRGELECEEGRMPATVATRGLPLGIVGTSPNQQWGGAGARQDHYDVDVERVATASRALEEVAQNDEVTPYTCTRSLPAHLMPGMHGCDPQLLPSASKKLSRSSHVDRDAASKMFLQWSNTHVVPGMKDGLPEGLKGGLCEPEKSEEAVSLGFVENVAQASDQEMDPTHAEEMVVNGKNAYPDVSLHKQMSNTLSTCRSLRHADDEENIPHYLGGTKPPPTAARAGTTGIETCADTAPTFISAEAVEEDSQLPVSSSSHPIGLEEQTNEVNASASAECIQVAEQAAIVVQGGFASDLAERMDRSWVTGHLGERKEEAFDTGDGSHKGFAAEDGVEQQPPSLGCGTVVETKSVVMPIHAPLHMGLDPPIDKPFVEETVVSLPSGRQSARSSGRSRTKSVSSEVELLPLCSSFKEGQPLDEGPNQESQTDGKVGEGPERAFSCGVRQWHPSSFLYPMWRFWSTLSQGDRPEGSTVPASSEHPNKALCGGNQQGVPTAKDEGSLVVGSQESQPPSISVQTRGLNCPFEREEGAQDEGSGSDTNKLDEKPQGRGELLGNEEVAESSIQTDQASCGDVENYMNRFWFGGLAADEVQKLQAKDGLVGKGGIPDKVDEGLKGPGEHMEADAPGQSAGVDGNIEKHNDVDTLHSDQQVDELVEVDGHDNESFDKDLSPALGNKKGDFGNNLAQGDAQSSGTSEGDVHKVLMNGIKEEEEEVAGDIGPEDGGIVVDRALMGISDLGEDLMPNSIIMEGCTPDPTLVIKASRMTESGGTDSDTDSVDFASFQLEARSVAERILGEAGKDCGQRMPPENDEGVKSPHFRENEREQLDFEDESMNLDREGESESSLAMGHASPRDLAFRFFGLMPTQREPGQMDLSTESKCDPEDEAPRSSQEHAPEFEADLQKAGFGSIAFTGSMKDRILKGSLDENNDQDGAGDTATRNPFSTSAATNSEALLPSVQECHFSSDDQPCKVSNFHGAPPELEQASSGSSSEQTMGATPPTLRPYVFTFGASLDESSDDVPHRSPLMTVDDAPEVNPFQIDQFEEDEDVPRFGLGYKSGGGHVQPVGQGAVTSPSNMSALENMADDIQSIGEDRNVDRKDEEAGLSTSVIGARGLAPDLLQGLGENSSGTGDAMDIDEEEEAGKGASTVQQGFSQKAPNETSPLVDTIEQGSFAAELIKDVPTEGLSNEEESIIHPRSDGVSGSDRVSLNEQPEDRDSRNDCPPEVESMGLATAPPGEIPPNPFVRSLPVPSQSVFGDVESKNDLAEGFLPGTLNSPVQRESEKEDKQPVSDAKIEDQGEQDESVAPAVHSRGLPPGLLFDRDTVADFEANQPFENLHPTLEKVNKRNAALQEQVRSVKQDLEYSQGRISDVLQQRETLQQLVQEGKVQLDKKSKELHRTVEEQGQMAGWLENTLNEGKVALAALKEAQQDKQGLEESLAKICTANDDLKAMLSEKDKAMEHAEEQHSRVAKELQDSKEREVDLAKEVQALTLVKEKRDSELAQHESAMQATQDKCEQLAGELEKAREHETNLRQQVEALGGDMDRLREALSLRDSELQNALEDQGVLTKQLDEAKQQEQELLQHAAAMEAAQKSSKIELEKRESAAEEAGDEMKKLLDELSSARELELKLVNEVEICSREADQLKTGLAKKENEAQEAMEAHQAVLQELEGARAKARELETQVAVLAQEIDSLKVRLSQSNKESQELEAHRGQLAKELADVQKHEAQLLGEVDSLARDGNEARELLANRERALSEEVDNLQAKHKSVLSELAAANQRNVHLEGLVAEGERVREEMGDKLKMQQMDIEAAAEAADTMVQDLDETQKAMIEMAAASHDLEDGGAGSEVRIQSRGLPSSFEVILDRQGGCPQCPTYLAQLEKITQERDELKAQLADVIPERDHFEAQLANVLLERDELKALVSILSSEKEVSKKKASKMREQLAESEASRLENTEAFKRVQRNEVKLQALQEEAQTKNRQMTEELGALKAELANKTEEMSQALELLRAKNQKGADALKAKEEECQKLLKSIERSSDDRAKLEMMVADLSSERDDLKTQLASAQNTMQKTSEDFFDSLKLERSEKNSATANVATLRTDCDMLAGKVAKLQREKQEIQQESAALQERHDALVSKKLDLERKLADAKAGDGGGGVQNQVESVDLLRLELAEAISEQERMRGVLRQRDGEVEQLKADMEELNLASSALRDEVESTRNKNAELHQEMERISRGVEGASVSQLTTGETEDGQHVPRDTDRSSDAQGSVRSRTVEIDLCNPFFESVGVVARSDSSVVQLMAHLEKDELIARVIDAEKVALNAKNTLNRSRHMHVKKMKEVNEAAEQAEQEIVRLQTALAAMEAKKSEGDAKLLKVKSHSDSLEVQLEAVQLLNSIQTDSHPDVDETIEKTRVEVQKLMEVNRELKEENNRVCAELQEVRDSLQEEKDDRREAMEVLEDKMKSAELEVDSLSNSLNDIVQTTMSLGSDLESARAEKNAHIHRLAAVSEEKRSIQRELRQCKDALAEVQSQGRAGPSLRGTSRQVQTMPLGGEVHGKLKEGIDEMALEVEKLGVVFHSLGQRGSAGQHQPGMEGLETVLEESSGVTEESTGNSGQSEGSFDDVDVDVPPGEFGMGEAKGKKGRKKKSKRGGSEKRAESSLPRPPSLAKPDNKDLAKDDQRLKPSGNGGPSVN